VAAVGDDLAVVVDGGRALDLVARPGRDQVVEVLHRAAAVDGYGPKPTDMAKACGTTIYAAQAATTGMRRSELAGVDRDMLDLDQGTVTIENTRVVVKGHATDSDGKTEGSPRTISLDPFTVAELRRFVEMIEGERDAFRTSYPDHGMLMCFEDGRRLHPDTVTSRFNRLVDQAGVRGIRLHDVRHTYAALARDLGVNSKIVTDRLGHANETVTQQIYTHPSTRNDRPAAEMIARLIAEALGTEEADLRAADLRAADLGACWSQSWSHGQ
jgi:integrase